MGRRIAIAVLVAVAAACEPVSQPVGETRLDCQGVPPQQCQQALVDARAGSNVPVVEVVVRCSAPPCALQRGQIAIEAHYADGTTRGWGSAWEDAIPAPMPVEPGPPEPAVPLPVEPTCLGVDQSVCLNMARTAMENLPPGSPPVASITVRCTAVCLPTKGEGDSVVVFADGTTSTSGWGYETTGG